MEGLELLGAADALSSQYITFRIKKIDQEKLKSGLGSAAPYAAAALHFVDASPRAALDTAKPLIVGELKNYGIDAEVTISNVPPAKGGRAFSEFWPGLAVGGVLGGGSLLIVKLLARAFARR